MAQVSSWAGCRFCHSTNSVKALKEIKALAPTSGLIFFGATVYKTVRPML